MRIGRFVSACSDAVRDRMRWLPGIAGCVDAIANDAIDVAQRSAVADTTDGIGKYLGN